MKKTKTDTYTVCIYLFFMVIVLLIVIAAFLIVYFRNQQNNSEMKDFLTLAIIPFVIGVLSYLLNRVIFEKHDIDYVNEKFTEEVKKLGSIYFTGVTKIIQDGFNSITPPVDYIKSYDYSDKTVRVLFIGVSKDFFPKFVLNEITNSNNLPELKMLYSLDKKLSAMRQKSHTYRTSDTDEYFQDNQEKYASLKRFLIHAVGEDVYENQYKKQEYSSFPFGIMIASGNYIWFSPLWIDKDVAGKGPILEIRYNSELGKEIIRSFESLFTITQEYNKRLTTAST
jgi:hypothetical protein